MLEDPARDERVGEGGDTVAAAAALGAAQHVHREGPLEEFGPALALWFGAGVGFGLGFGLADAWRGAGPAGWACGLGLRDGTEVGTEEATVRRGTTASRRGEAGARMPK